MRNKAINEKSMKKISKDISSISISMIMRRQSRKAKVRHIDEMADRLVRIYGADKSRQFFLKCYWYLDERFIDDVVEKSKSPCVHAPLKYFIASCHNEMLKIGV